MKNRHKFTYLFVLVLVCTGIAPIPDPTRPPDYLPTQGVAAGTSQQFKLQAIYIHTNKSQVMLDGRLYQLGDKYGEYTITTIEPYTVELKSTDGQVQLLHLAQPIKQPTTLKGQ